VNHELLVLLGSFNLGLLLALALRLIWRRHFGATATYALWLLPPMLALVTRLPSASTPPEPVRVLLLQVSESLPALDEGIASSHSSVLLWIWLAGALGTIASLMLSRRRLSRRLANLAHRTDPRCPQLPVARADFGPAIVGLWRPILVLPHDFEQRFDSIQQSLVFAHEAAHHAAGDLWVRALALQLCVAQWWNPLCWWALLRLIDDQEAACDARVLRASPQALLAYAKTLAAGHGGAQPGAMLMCSLHPTHPLIRRIAMLKHALASPRSRNWANALTLACLLGASGLAWAVGGSRSSPDSGANTPDYYVAISAQIDESPTSEFGLAGTRDTTMSAQIDDASGVFDLDLMVSTTDIPNQALLSMVVRRDAVEIGRPQIIMPIGQAGKIQIGEQSAEGFKGIRLDTTVLPWGERVSLKPSASTARQLAQQLAAQSSLTLEGIELLPDAPMQASFDAVQAESALQMIAQMNGLKAIRDGNHIRLEAQ
jgi:beta-lactamase regulating signal transducer with metallopeptidase domain